MEQEKSAVGIGVGIEEVISGIGKVSYNFSKDKEIETIKIATGKKPRKFKSILTAEDNKRIDVLYNRMKEVKNNLDQGFYKTFLQEYIELKLKDIIANDELFDKLKHYRVLIENDENRRNYISCSISLNFYNSEKDKTLHRTCTGVNVDLKELFNNCSSVVIANLGGGIITESPYGIYNPMIDKYIESKSAPDNFIREYMNLLVEISDKILGYSVVMYTYSVPESNKSLGRYLKDNWEVIKQFVNKRTRHEIIYYIKDLTKN